MAASAEIQSELSGVWSWPTTVRFGAGRIDELAAACREIGMERPLLVTDSGLAQSTMVADAVAANAADKLSTAVFAAIKANPTGANVEAGVANFHAGGHDGIVALGGGSALDAGKAIAFMAGQRRPIWDFIDEGDNWRRAVAAGIAPLVAVPTTAGTGSEVGRAAVIVDEDARRKRIIFHPDMMPRIVISDPALTVGLPPAITAATGMDALTHCFEAFCARSFHPMADGVALEGMKIIQEWLPRAFADGADLAARAHMLAAASMGATAFQKGLGAVHALSHPVGALHDTHHGLTNAVILPYVLAFNRSAVGEKLQHLSNVLGLGEPAFNRVMGWILDLRSRLGIPDTLVEIGVDDRYAEEIARAAAEDPSADGNPLPVGSRELETVFRNALEGRL